jgi:hypothetical protein
MRKLVIFLILLAVLLAVLDRVAVAGVQREVARQVAAKYDLATPPEVTIGGIPFLTQAIAGRYEEISVAMGSLERRGVRLSSVDATLYNVTAPLADLLQNAQGTEIRAERVVGSIVISHQTIAQRAPRGINVSGDGDNLVLSGDLTVAGVTVPVQAAMKLEIVEDGVRLTPEKVTVAGGIPVPRNATRALTYTIPIENLPLNLRLTGVASDPEGLRVTGEATDVPLRE